ncbi:hypothetical protein PbB2_01467 [Candidatus Phycosocius bacilliformis]|uniref:Cytoplasmic protein n=1 Tax=Candidatus Phycosocius bacilliformis TaxID=1445552 RepID=A0A2P2E9Q1_9PROT|nr:cell cycle transcriptional regulator TrcR [Candidatus Phycosocius bacilliformis]GBF57797.1 hypothetical protein PbB2_01467 [Candidatus Phycosocius bacilliformis]
MFQILMPKATAVWLIDNTGLTFDQIAAFCGLHPLEVKGIADGDVAAGVRGLDPIANSQLSREEIARGEADPTYKIKPLEGRKLDLPPVKKRGGRYTPVSRRQDRPDAIAWFLRYHPEISDAQMGKLIGTTKSTIESVRNRTHWNSAQIKPVDPVTIGLCTQIELDALVKASSARRSKLAAEAGTPDPEDGPSLQPAAQSGYYEEERDY